jgi:hypothetical protein
LLKKKERFSYILFVLGGERTGAPIPVPVYQEGVEVMQLERVSVGVHVQPLTHLYIFILQGTRYTLLKLQLLQPDLQLPSIIALLYLPLG